MNKLRKNFNDKVREWGNRISLMPKRYREMGHMDLGDILTAEITPRRVGATIGALTPLAGLYGMEYATTGSHLFSAIMTPAVYVMMFPFTVSTSIALGLGGYMIGAKLENKISEFKNSVREYIGRKE